MFKIGDRVKKTLWCFYNHNGDKSIPIGTIIDIRARYQNTFAYIVLFDGKSLTNELENQYTESSLKLISQP